MKLLQRSAGMLAVAVFGMATGSTVAAKVFTVGADSSCSHHSLDQAITAARASAGHDEIRLARNLVQESALAQQADSDITLNGGYSNCADSQALGITRVHVLGPVDTEWLAQHAHGDGLRFEPKTTPTPSSRGALMTP